MEKKKKFRLFDAILGTVCLTLVCESVMPTAAIGNTIFLVDSPISRFLFTLWYDYSRTWNKLSK